MVGMVDVSTDRTTSRVRERDKLVLTCHRLPAAIFHGRVNIDSQTFSSPKLQKILHRSKNLKIEVKESLRILQDREEQRSIHSTYMDIIIVTASNRSLAPASF